MRHTDNLHIKFKKNNTLTVIIVTVLFVALSMIVLKLGFISVYATKGDDIARITDEKQRLVEENKSLETEIAQYQSLTRIQKEATERLGMVKAKPVKYVNISTTSVKN